MQLFLAPSRLAGKGNQSKGYIDSFHWDSLMDNFFCVS